MVGGGRRVREEKNGSNRQMPSSMTADFEHSAAVNCLDTVLVLLFLDDILLDHELAVGSYIFVTSNCTTEFCDRL